LAPERRVPELIPVLGSQPAGDVHHQPDGRLPLLSARPVPKLHIQLLLLVHKAFYHPEKLPEGFRDYFEINNTFQCHHTK